MKILGFVWLLIPNQYSRPPSVLPIECRYWNECLYYLNNDSISTRKIIARCWLIINYFKRGLSFWYEYIFYNTLINNILNDPINIVKLIN